MNIKNGHALSEAQNLLSLINTYKLAHDIVYSAIFYDEPKYFMYSATIRNDNYFNKNSHYGYINNNLGSGGISLECREYALVRTLAELIERFCLVCFEKARVVDPSSSKLRNNQFQIGKYLQNKSTQEKIHWIKGWNLLTNSTCLLPAQSIYLTAREYYQEPQLFVPISTGAAVARALDLAVLKGIYENIERDAIMSSYLLQIPLPGIDPAHVDSAKIKGLNLYLKRYKLRWILLNAQNDLSVPIFISIVVDNSLYGPAITIGSRAGYDDESSIIHSLEEALMARPHARNTLLIQKTNQFETSTEDIKTQSDRLLFWFSKKTSHYLNFWLKSKNKPYRLVKKRYTTHDAMQKAITALKKSGHDTYWADITLPEISRKGYCATRVIIPELQPLYLEEHNKVFMTKRLEKIAMHYGLKKIKLNTIPHPFL